MSKHTPGPWGIRTHSSTGDCGIVAEGTGVFAEAFADIRHAGEGARDEAAANARLIAAAPEMLGALLYIRGIASRNAVERSYSAEDQRRAIAHLASLAIAKAGGQS